jgi:hypothetical protein
LIDHFPAGEKNQAGSTGEDTEAGTYGRLPVKYPEVYAILAK